MFKSFIKKLNKALRDDSGASLLELIIAVTILAIVTAPLLNTFIVSAKLNAKAKTMGLETDAITSIYEKIKGTDSSYIVTADSDAKQTDYIKNLFQADSAGITQTMETSSDGLYRQLCRQVDIDLTNVKSGYGSDGSDRRFDARVSMTAVPTDTGSDGTLIDASLYTNQDITNDNNTARAVQMSFNNVWVQPTDDSSDPDKIMQSYLPHKLDADGNELDDQIDKTADAKGQKIIKNQRFITVTLNKTGSAGSDATVKVTPTITYRYDIEWRAVDDTGKLVTKKIYSDDDSESKPADSEATAVYKRNLNEFTYQEAGETSHHFFDVMLFYEPYYQAVNPDNGRYDTIDIDNEGNLEGDIFIVKENQNDGKEYSGIIRLIEDHPSDPDNFNLKVHTNMGLKKTADLLNGKQVLSGGIFTLVRIYNPKGYYKQSVDLRTTDRNCSVTSLIKEEAIDHIYKVTITLYQPGTLAGTTPQKICTFNGLKVN